MKKIYLLILMAFGLGCIANGQTWTWDTVLNSTFDPVSLVKDHQRNIYSFSKSGNVLTKHSIAGALIWEKSLPVNIRIRNIAFDNANDPYIIASFNDTISFEGQVIINNSYFDILLIKYDQYSNFIWYKTISGIGDDYAGDICFDHFNNLLVTGSTIGNTSFSATTVNASAHPNLFIARYDISGNYINSFFSTWLDGTGGASGNEIEVNQNNDIVLFSSIDAKFQFDTLIIDAEAEGYIFLFDNGFNLKWVRDVEYVYAKEINDMIINSNNEIFYNINNVWHTGHDGWIKKISPDGLTQTTLKHVSGGYITGIDTDISGDIYYASGRSEKNVNYPAIPRFDFMTFARINSTGNSVWEKTDSSYSVMRGEDIAVDGSDVFVCGYFIDSVHLYNNYQNANGRFFATMLNSSAIGISELKETVSLLLYPNPSTGQFTLNLSNASSNSTICIHDIFGNCILSKTLHSNKEAIDLSGNARGMYFIEVSDGNSKHTSKLILN